MEPPLAGDRSVEFKLPLTDSTANFNLEKAVCSHGFFMTAPNQWDPLSKTFKRPLRLLTHENEEDDVVCSPSVTVEISQPLECCDLLVRVFDMDTLSTEDHQSLTEQVRRMLRLSDTEDKNVREFQEIYSEAKASGFGRIFRWSRTLSMARALCELQLELQRPTPSETDKRENLMTKFAPVTPAKKETTKRKMNSQQKSRNVAKRCSEIKSAIEAEATLRVDCTETAIDIQESSIAGFVNESSEKTELPFLSSMGNFPSPKELGSLDENFLAKRCNLGYRASRILRLAQGVVKGTIDLRQIEEDSREASLSKYMKLNEQLGEIYGFGAFTRANVLMCLGFYHVIPSDSETLRHLYQVHKKKSTIKNIQQDIERIYGKYEPFQFLVYWYASSVDLFQLLLWTSFLSRYVFVSGVILMALQTAWQNTTLNWKGSDPCDGTWLGIGCTNSRVTSLILSSMGLTGGLPGDIGEFTELQILDLSYNTGLTGTLTPAIGKLNKLTNLVIVGCRFTGPIPSSIGNLENLQYIGPIPATLGNLKNLYWLDLSANKLTGSLPVSDGLTPGLDLLTNIKHFHFGDNQLSGDIPPSLCNLNMTRILHLLFEKNQFNGSIPSTLGSMQSLEIMFLSNNRLTGPIPNLTGLNLLSYLDLSNNSFDQSYIPSWFSTLQSLTTLKMHYTNLVGELPAALFSFPQLQNVDLSNNRINGSLDISSNPSKQLERIDLQTNLIEDFVQRDHYTIDLVLVDNTICTGSRTTDRFCSLVPKNTSTLYSSKYNDCVPSSCDLGLVSSQNCQCAYPFIGLILFKAPSFSTLENTTIYDTLHDNLTAYYQKVKLPVDSVLLNNPSRNLVDYLAIKLHIFPSGEPSFNRTGIIGVSFALSSQGFSSPKGFNTYTFIAENYLNFLSEISGPGGTKTHSSSTGIIVGSAIGGCVLVGLLILAGIYALRQKGRAERATQQKQPFASWDPEGGSGGVPKLKGARSFTFEELSKCTSNFSEINNIGRGGYGMVYKGTLPNGQLIAIKRAQQGSTQGGLEFKTEIELLSRVHHKNVVGLIGFCFDQGEQMLVYEFIVNGTLKDTLSGRSGIRLDWIRRLKIAAGAARGLQYLHDLADPPIIHRDIKTNNILLDQRLVAKVADFGLSKPMTDANRAHITTQVKGTLGYMDPEYYMTQQLTEKSDVYSFGVVMLELITARNPIENGRYIVREVKQAMNKNMELYDLHEVLDPIIGLSSELKGLERFVDLSLKCVEETGNLRPAMSEVVKELESIMALVGLKPGTGSSSSTSAATYEGGKDFSHPYSNDSLFAYSGGLLPPKLHP
nr:probable leucine-rich repeat receptor-like protein kinase At5g49770 [Tanacetum cinerariifolium]